MLRRIIDVILGHPVPPDDERSRKERETAQLQVKSDQTLQHIERITEAGRLGSYRRVKGVR